LIFTPKYLLNSTWWKEIHGDYNLSNCSFAIDIEKNYMKELDYIDQHIGNSYYIFIFSSFEHSFRRISKAYDLQRFNLDKNNFESLFKNTIKGIIPEENKNNFIEIDTILRNSIHNNGAYVSRSSSKDRHIKWNGKSYNFKQEKPIKTDLWKLNIDFTKELIHIFDRINEFEPLMSIRAIQDPTE
jgi:hypothetical protein